MWRRQWHPTPVLLPGKSHGRRSLVGCSPWGRKRIRQDWATSLSLFTFMRWRRKWQPTPVILPGESQGRGGLVGCRLWGRTELDTIEATQLQQQHQSINNKSISHSSGGWKSEIGGQCVQVQVSILFWAADCHLLIVSSRNCKRVTKLWVPFITMPISFMKSLFSWPNYLPKALLPNTIILRSLALPFFFFF